MIARASRVERNTSDAPVIATERLRTWVSFSFGRTSLEATTQGHQGLDSQSGDQYRIEEVRTVRGLAPKLIAPGQFISRRETAATAPTIPHEGALVGARESRLSSTLESEAALLDSWKDSPWRVALLLPLAHGPAYWALPKDERTAIALNWPHGPWGVSRGPAVLGRVLRRVYRARLRPENDWDFLAYLEMQPSDVAYIRDYLAELRNQRTNPAWRHVMRDTEIWMTKQLGTPGAGSDSGA